MVNISQKYFMDQGFWIAMPILAVADTIHVFPQSDAAATNYLIMRFSVATIQGQILIEGGVYLD